ncbi:MAG: pentapeptide repeat-containing protein [Pseudomonadales bacterium]|nr:pentapeptide repeat-containing protein [Pseudomonadales bacterium]
MLARADLTFANLKGVNLKAANLTGVNFYGADFKDAWVTDADLRAARHVTCEQLQQANNWEHAHRSEDLACGAPFQIQPMMD